MLSFRKSWYTQHVFCIVLLSLCFIFPLRFTSAQPRVSQDDVGIDVSVKTSIDAAEQTGAINPDPVPSSQASPSDDIEVDQSFTVEVVAENKGDDADYGGIAFSFPDLDRRGDASAVERISTTYSSEYKTYESGEEIYPKNGDDQITADYLLVQTEAFRTDGWDSGETRKLKIKVSPSEGAAFSTGEFEVNWRVTADDESFPGKNRAHAKDQQGWYVKQPTVKVYRPGDLQLQVENIDKGSDEVPRGNGEVQLFDETGEEIGEPESTDPVGDGDGEVIFTDLNPSIHYRAEVYHDPDDTPFGSREYWGEARNLAVSPGETEEYSFERRMPYRKGEFHLAQGGEEVTGGSVVVGEEVTVTVELKTRSNGKESVDARPRIAFDQDRDRPYDFEETGSYKDVEEGYTKLYQFTWTPEEPGDYYRAYEVQVDENGDQVTDSAPFDDYQILTVERPPKASLKLRVENIAAEWASNAVPRDNGEVKLFDESGNQIGDTKSTDLVDEETGAGEVTFTDLDPTEDYRAEVYHDPDDTPFGSREYWASVSGIDVQPGETRDLTIVRSKPFISLFRAVQGGEEVTGGSVTAGEEVTVEVQIQNPSDGETADVRPRVALKNNQGEEVFDETGDYETVTDGYKSTLYSFTWTPQEAGEYYRGYEVQIDAGRDQVTDSAPFKTKFVTVEEPPPAAIDLRVENVDVEGASNTVPGDNGEVELFDEDGNQIRDTKSTELVDEETGAGEVTFTNLDPSKSYEAEIYHDNENSPLGITEYWGKKAGISVSSGETTDAGFTREQPYLQGLEVLNSDGENVTTETVELGTPLTVNVTVKNEGFAQDVQPRFVLDDNRDGLDSFLYDETRPTKVIANGDTETFSFSWTPEEPGDVYRTYVINGVVPDEDGGFTSGPTGSGGWWDKPLVSIEENKAPTVTVDEQTHPSSMYPGRIYTFETTYSDENGTSDVTQFDLYLKHPSDTDIHLRKNKGEPVEVRSGNSFLDKSALEAKPFDLDEPNRGRIGWTLAFKSDPSTDWAAVEERSRGITFETDATDKSEETSESSVSSTKASYRNYGTTVLTHGLQFVFSSSGDKLSRWLRDAACFIRQKAGGGKIVVYDHRDGELKPIGHSDFQSDFYQYFDERKCPEVGNSENMIKIDMTSGEGERIIVFDWTKDSMDPGLGYSEAAANALFASLKEYQNGHTLEPIHLIGHSRGTTVMSETAERLLASGGSVDHVTYLDPHDWGYNISNFSDITSDLEKLLSYTGGRAFHDLDANSFVVDDPMIPDDEEYAYTNPTANSGTVTWSGVRWSEAYWQSNSDKDIQFEDSQRKASLADGTYDTGNCYRYLEDDLEDKPLTDGVLKVLNGRPVKGSYNGNWSGISEIDSNGEECEMNHSGIYREYIRTIEDTENSISGYNFSRIGGYPENRPENEKYGSDFSKVPQFDFVDVGSAIPNGNFERGRTPSFLPEKNLFCHYEGGCISGWNAHGGSGTTPGGEDPGAEAEIMSRFSEGEDKDLVLGYKRTYGSGNDFTPTESARKSDRFYVPNYAEYIVLEYNFIPGADDVSDTPDVFRVETKKDDDLSEVFRTSEPESPQDGFQNAKIPLGSSQTGSTLQVRFSVTNDAGVESRVAIDNVRIRTAGVFVENYPADIERRLGNGSASLDLTDIFSNPGGGALSYEVSSSDASVAGVSESNGTLTLDLMSGGSTNIELKATDGDGNKATASFTLTVLDTPLPSPTITNRNDPQSKVQPGGDLSLSLEVTNDGGPATYGSISASFPDYDQPGDAEQVQPSSSMSEGDVPGYVERPKGQPIYKKGGEEIAADYLLAEYADDDWESGETNTLDLQVTAPEEEGTFTVYVRTTLSSGKETVTEPGEDSDAQTATDQQGYRVFEIPVQVSEDTDNRPPTISTNERLTVEEGKSVPITTEELSASDEDNGPSELTFTVISGPSQGNLLVDGAQASSFTQADLETGAVEYGHTTGTAENDSFTFDLTDPSGAGPSGQTFSITVEPSNTAPSAPAGLTATGGDQQVNLSWDSNPESDMDGGEYRVHRSTTDGFSPGNGTLVEVPSHSGGGESYTDDGSGNLSAPSNGTTYRYKIVAVDEAGNRSPSSNQAEATPQSGEMPTANHKFFTRLDPTEDLNGSFTLEHQAADFQGDAQKVTTQTVGDVETARFPGTWNGEGDNSYESSVSNAAGLKQNEALTGAGDQTHMFWYKSDGERPENSSGTQYVVALRGNWWGYLEVRLRNDLTELAAEFGHQSRSGYEGDIVMSDQDPADGRWHHVAVTHSGDITSLYFDGEKVGSKKQPEGTANNRRSQFGMSRSSSAPLYGNIYNYRVFEGYVASRSEIRSDYNRDPFSGVSSQLERSIALSAGWNMVGMPLRAGGASSKGLGAALPEGCGTRFRWRPGQGLYQEFGSGEGLSPGQGAWTFCESGATVEVTGQPVATSKKTVQVEAGWNQVGPFEEAVAPSDVAQKPSGILERGTWFRWDPSQGRYTEPTSLEPGAGYWVFATGSGTLDFSGGGGSEAATASAGAAEAQANGKASTSEAPEGALKLHVTEEGGHEATLYLAPDLTEEEQKRWRLPPVGPGGAFDVRFAGGFQAAQAGGSSSETGQAGRREGALLRVRGAEDPVTLRLGASKPSSKAPGQELESRSIRVVDAATGGKQVEARLTGESPAATVPAGIERLRVQVGEVPEKITLRKPYPSPARRQATVEYSLPEQREVRIAVYDVLGRRGETVTDRKRGAGTYRATLEADRLPSGTYFVRMHAGSFQKTRRLAVVE